MSSSIDIVSSSEHAAEQTGNFVVGKANIMMGALTSYVTNEGVQVIGIGDGAKMTLFTGKAASALASLLKNGKLLGALSKVEQSRVVQAAVQGLKSDTAKVIGEVGEGAALPASAAYAGYDLLKIYDDKNGTLGQAGKTLAMDTVPGGAAYLLLHGVSGAAAETTAVAEGSGLAATIGSAAVVAAPIVISGAFLYRDIKLSDINNTHAKIMKGIEVDTHGLTNLQKMVEPQPDKNGQAHSFRETVENYKRSIHEQGKHRQLSTAENAFLYSDFAWKGDTIDVKDANNTAALRAYIKVQQEHATHSMLTNDQWASLPDGARSQGRQIEFNTQEEARARLDAAGTELNTLRTRSTAIAAKTPEQVHADIEAAKHDGTTATQAVYSVKDGNFVAAGGGSAQIPDQIQKMFRENGGKRIIVTQLHDTVDSKGHVTGKELQTFDIRGETPSYPTFLETEVISAPPDTPKLANAAPQSTPKHGKAG